MTFWIITAVLTASASLAVMYPFLRRNDSTAEGEYDLAVYKDQLAELDRDVKRGLISTEDAAEARAEIGRRIIRMNAAASAEGGKSGAAPVVRIVAAFGILAVPVISWGLYSYLGSPGVPAMPLAERLQNDPAGSSIAELIGRAETHLASNPEDLKGWETLGPVYMRLGRYQDAARAYRQIIALGGANANTYSVLGEALVGMADGVVTAEAVASFEKTLSMDPKEPRAQFFVGLARAQEGKMDEARTLWTNMLADLPENSPWREVAGQALAQRGEGAASEPANAERQASDDQQQMIEEMVARLDARLKESPNDPEGWQRLVRSYIVLERKEDARAALKRGIKALGEGSPSANDLSTFAQELGITLPEEKE